MRLSNFIFLSVLSFADKPKLAYLTRPTKKGEKRANCLQKIDTNSNMTFESKMNLKSISVCSKSIKITAILIIFFRWLQYLWTWYNWLSFSVRKSSLYHTQAEVLMEVSFQTCEFVLLFALRLKLTEKRKLNSWQAHAGSRANIASSSNLGAGLI